MKRRSALRRFVACLGALGLVGLDARPASAYYYFFEYRFQYFVHRNRRRLRWRIRR